VGTQLHDIAQAGELDQFGQTSLDAVEPDPASAPDRGQVQSGQRIDGVEIGRHQPGDIEVHRAVMRCTVPPALALVVRHPLE
jgi:hypothetical protein